MVQVPTNLTALPSNNAWLTLVIERTSNMSASRTSLAVRSLPGFLTSDVLISPKKASNNGMFSSATIFILLTR